MIDNDEIGSIQGVIIRFYRPPSQADLKHAAQWRVDPAIAGGGYFVDMGSHMIDLIQYFLGPIVSAAGFYSNQGNLYQVEDTVCGAFNFESDALGVGLWRFAASEDLDVTEISGSRGKISYSTFLEQPVLLESKGTVRQFEIPHPVHIQQPLIQIIVDELLGSGKSPSTGRTGAMTSWVMDRMLGRI